MRLNLLKFIVILNFNYLSASELKTNDIKIEDWDAYPSIFENLFESTSSPKSASSDCCISKPSGLPFISFADVTHTISSRTHDITSSIKSKKRERSSSAESLTSTYTSGIKPTFSVNSKNIDFVMKNAFIHISSKTIPGASSEIIITPQEAIDIIRFANKEVSEQKMPFNCSKKLKLSLAVNRYLLLNGKI